MLRKVSKVSHWLQNRRRDEQIKHSGYERTARASEAIEARGAMTGENEQLRATRRIDEQQNAAFACCQAF